MRTGLILLLSLASLLALSPGAKAAADAYVIFTEGTLTTLDPQMKELEVRQYICQRVCFPADKRIEESYLSWVGEDTDSLREWQQDYVLDGAEFTLECEDWTAGSGTLTGRMWSWDKISYSYTASDELRYSFEGTYSGRRCQRAGVAVDAAGKLQFLLKDESSVITEEEYVVMQSIYERIKLGYN